MLKMRMKCLEFFKYSMLYLLDLELEELFKNTKFNFWKK